MTSLRIFVKRGAIWRFHRLTRDAQKLPISVEWDRRKEDRRAAAAPVEQEQRREDRRGTAPFTWDTAEFVIVDDGAAFGADRSSNPTDQPREPR